MKSNLSKLKTGYVLKIEYANKQIPNISELVKKQILILKLLRQNVKYLVLPVYL